MDPVQMQVMKVMPVAISVIFIWLPSSLVLYSVANAAFSLIQQKMMYSKYGASDFKAPGGVNFIDHDICSSNPNG